MTLNSSGWVPSSSNVFREANGEYILLKRVPLGAKLYDIRIERKSAEGKTLLDPSGNLICPAIKQIQSICARTLFCQVNPSLSSFEYKENPEGRQCLGHYTNARDLEFKSDDPIFIGMEKINNILSRQKFSWGHKPFTFTPATIVSDEGIQPSKNSSPHTVLSAASSNNEPSAPEDESIFYKSDENAEPPPPREVESAPNSSPLKLDQVAQNGDLNELSSSQGELSPPLANSSFSSSDRLIQGGQETIPGGLQPLTPSPSFGDGSVNPASSGEAFPIQGSREAISLPTLNSFKHFASEITQKYIKSLGGQEVPSCVRNCELNNIRLDGQDREQIEGWIKYLYVELSKDESLKKLVKDHNRNPDKDFEQWFKEFLIGQLTTGITPYPNDLALNLRLST